MLKISVTVDHYVRAIRALKKNPGTRCAVCILSQAINDAVPDASASVGCSSAAVGRTTYFLDSIAREIRYLFDTGNERELLPMLPATVTLHTGPELRGQA